jgi:hypothetical protein
MTTNEFVIWLDGVLTGIDGNETVDDLMAIIGKNLKEAVQQATTKPMIIENCVTYNNKALKQGQS